MSCGEKMFQWKHTKRRKASFGGPSFSTGIETISIRARELWITSRDLGLYFFQRNASHCAPSSSASCATRSAVKKTHDPGIHISRRPRRRFADAGAPGTSRVFASAPRTSRIVPSPTSSSTPSAGDTKMSVPAESELIETSSGADDCT